VVSDFQVSGVDATTESSGSAGLTESVTFNFGKIEFEYTSQKADGTLEPGIKFGWDVNANQSI